MKLDRKNNFCIIAFVVLFLIRNLGIFTDLIKLVLNVLTIIIFVILALEVIKDIKQKNYRFNRVLVSVVILFSILFVVTSIVIQL